MNLPKFYLIKGLGFVNPYEYNSPFTGELIASNPDYIKLLSLIKHDSFCDDEDVPPELSGYHVSGDYYIIWMTTGDVEAIVEYLLGQMSQKVSAEIEEQYIQRIHIWPGVKWDEKRDDFYDLVRSKFLNSLNTK
jgi:hypothetical protein